MPPDIPFDDEEKERLHAEAVKIYIGLQLRACIERLCLQFGREHILGRIRQGEKGLLYAVKSASRRVDDEDVKSIAAHAIQAAKSGQAISAGFVSTAEYVLKNFDSVKEDSKTAFLSMPIKEVHQLCLQIFTE